jgi:hypothetical protein
MNFGDQRQCDHVTYVTIRIIAGEKNAGAVTTAFCVDIYPPFA